MGNKLKQSSLFQKTALSQIGHRSTCPNCQQQFEASITYQTSYKPSDHERLRMQRRKRSKDSIGSSGGTQDNDYITVQLYTKRKSTTPHTSTWQKTKLTYSQSLLTSLPPESLRTQTSAYKLLWLHHKLTSLHLSWKQGSQSLTFHPVSVVEDSVGLLDVELWRELKLGVVGDVVHDAGGLLREWAGMVISGMVGLGMIVRNKWGYYSLNQQITKTNKIHTSPTLPTRPLQQKPIKTQTPIFTKINTQKITYQQLYELLGCVLAKIIIEKVTVPYSFDWMFISGLLGLPASLQCFYSYDRQIYNSLKYLQQLCQALKKQPQNTQKLQQLQSLYLTFTTPTNPPHQLLPNGTNIPITTPQQLQTYLTLYIQHISHKLIPLPLLQRFQPILQCTKMATFLQVQQFQVLLNGVDGDGINVSDWKYGTEYKEPLSQGHRVVGYFWSTVEKMSAGDRCRLLKFVTGAERLPVYGFKQHNMDQSHQKRSNFRKQIRKKHLHDLFQNIRRLNKERERLRQTNTQISQQKKQQIKQIIKTIIAKCLMYYHTKKYKQLMEQIMAVYKMMEADYVLVSIGVDLVLGQFGERIGEALGRDVEGDVLGKIGDQLGVKYEPSTISEEISEQTNVAIISSLLQLSTKIQYNKFSQQSAITITKPLFNILTLLPKPPHTSRTWQQILTNTLHSLNTLLDSPNNLPIQKQLQKYGLSSKLNQIINNSVQYDITIHAKILKLIFLYNATHENVQDLLNGITIVSADSQYKEKFVVYCIFVLRKGWRNLLELALETLNLIFQECPYFIDSIKTDYYGNVLQLLLDQDRKINVAALNLLSSLAFYSQSASDQLVQKNNILDFIYSRLVMQRQLPANDPYSKKSIQKCSNILCDLLLTKNNKLKKTLFNHHIWQLIYQSIQQNNRLFHAVVVFKFFFASMPRKQRNQVLPSFLEAVRHLPMENDMIPEIKEIKETLINVFYHSLEHNASQLHDQIVRLYETNNLLKHIEDFQAGLEKDQKMEST